MTVFHAYRAADRNSMYDVRKWRADFRGADNSRGNTARLVIRCPDDSRERTPHRVTITPMMAGFDTNDAANVSWPPDTHEGIRPFRDFIARLYVDGYLNSPGFTPIALQNQVRLSAHDERVPSVRSAVRFRLPENQEQTVATGNIWLQTCECTLHFSGPN
jgi:hypothetical protein